MKNRKTSYRKKISNAFILATVFLLSGCLAVSLPQLKISKSNDAKILTWDGLVRQTLSQNPDLQEARFQITSGERNKDSAFGDYLPLVQGEVQKNVGRSTNTSKTGDSLALNIKATQPIFHGGDITGKWIKAGRQLEALQWQYQTISSEVRYRLRSSYVELIRYERLLATNKQIEERRKQNAELVRLRYGAGRENLGSSLRAEAAASQAVYDVGQTQRQIESESLRLSRESGGEFVLPLTIGDDLEKMIEELRAETPNYVELAEANFGVNRLIKLAEAAKADMVSAQSSVLPQVDGTYNYGYSGDRSSNLRDSGSLGVSVSIPFFEGGKNVAAIRKAKADYEAAERTAKSARDEAVASLAEIWTKYVDAMEYVEVKKKFLEASRKRAEIIRAEYSSGLVNFTDFDTAEQESVSAEKDYVESLANVFQQQANWDKVRGVTLEDDYEQSKK